MEQKWSIIMDLGTFRELTKDLKDTTELTMFLGVVYKGDKIEREEIEADVVSIDIDKDDNGSPYIAIMDC